VCAGERERKGRQANYPWAERYDREQKDVFAVQDEASQAIVTILVAQATLARQSCWIGQASEDGSEGMSSRDLR